MNISPSPFVPENLVSRDGFGSPVPRQPAHFHTQAESVLTYGIPPDFRGGGGGHLLCIYECMVIHIARVRINRVRLPILLVVSWTGKLNISWSPFAPENLVSRDGFGSPVPYQPAHLSIEWIPLND